MVTSPDRVPDVVSLLWSSSCRGGNAVEEEVQPWGCARETPCDFDSCCLWYLSLSLLSCKVGSETLLQCHAEGKHIPAFQCYVVMQLFI
jgi:hypothetical protein